MQKSVITVFTSPTCPFCPAAKKLALEVSKERGDVAFVEQSTATRGGAEEAARYGVQSVPTVFVQGPFHDGIIAFRETPSKERLLHAVNVTQGIEPMQEKQNIFSKIKKLVQ